jgi:hypothetical protein
LGLVLHLQLELPLLVLLRLLLQEHELTLMTSYFPSR